MRDVAYIALGSNLGDRAAHLSRALLALDALQGSRILAASTVEETQPIGGIPQGAYLNQMVALETTLSPRELLGALQRIEERAGRVRSVRWGPRTLDLDIVCLERQRADDPDLVIPHPELDNRDFWLRQLKALKRETRGDFAR